MKIRTQSVAALTLLEVAAVLATVALLILFLLPGFQRTSRHGSAHARISCANNLKLAGLSYRIWAGDHDDRYPFAVSNRLGGTLEFAYSPEVFRHFAVMSNELVTPKVLVCPSDSAKTRSIDFAAFSNTNLSYFVGLDADETMPQGLLSGDRNITGGTLSNGFLRILTTNSLAGWTTELHNRSGNIGLADGSVQQVTEHRLRQQLEASALPIIRLAIP